MQNMPFTKGLLLHSKRTPFELQKDSFYNAIGPLFEGKI